jgi:serpin B
MLSSCSNDINGLDDDNKPNLRTLSSEEKSLAASSDDFVIDLFKELEQVAEGNLFFSPLSVQYALSMTLNGARDETFDGIKGTLGIEDLNEHEINEAYQSLTEFLLNVDKKVLLTIANSIWYEQKLTASESFKKAMQMYYDAEIAGLDFKSPQSVNTINNWVNTETNGLIKELINEIPPEAVMYLINAIYFKADWKYQFDEKATKNGPFYLEDGSEIATLLMRSDEVTVRYHKNSNAHVIDIPYGNGQFSMTVLLPIEGKKTKDILQVLDENTFNEWSNQLDSTEVELVMPKFKIEYKALLNDALCNMGMEIAFTENADFSRLFEEQYGLMISKVIHKAVIEVNEEGTEAAAVTGVEVSLTSLPPEKPVLTLNRPFLFFIREKHSGTVLFAGKLVDPTK